MENKLKEPYRNFEEAFLFLLQKAKKGPVSLKTFIDVLSGKGRMLLLIFLSLGFGQIPGAIFILGPFIIYLGIRIAIGKNFNWTPKWLQKKKIPSYFLVKNVEQILKFLKFMKRWSYPRHVWATQRPLTRIANGLMISLVGLSLSISPPVPFASWIAFIAIFLIGIGLLNNDGFYIIGGYAFAVFYFFFTCFLCKYCSLMQMVEWVRSGCNCAFNYLN